MTQANLPHPIPNETAEYREARNALLQKEVQLRQLVSDVAQARAALPPGGAVSEDYVFSARNGEVKLSDLFGPHDSLLVYSFMYGPNDEHPCPMCVSFIDSLNGAAPHIEQRTGLAVVTSSPVERTMELADSRGWSALNFMSCAGNSYNRDYYGETAEGGQLPICTVFARQNGEIRHHWSSEMFFADVPGHPRHVDQLWPLWNAFDLLPQGRGDDWFPALSYD